MSDTPACEKFELDQSASCPADAVEAVFPGGAVFRQAAHLQPFTFETGYLDPETGDPMSIENLQGYATEFRLDVTPDGLTTGIWAMDGMRKLLERNYRMLFLRATPSITEPDERTGAPAVGGIPFLVGDWWAAAIAARICDDYDLKCQWQAPNYLLQTDFSGVGRPFDLLRQLVEPFQSVPAFAVDIFCVADTVYVRARAGALTADANCTLSVHDARISRLSIRKWRGPVYGKISLLGMYGPWRSGGMLGTPTVYDYDESSTVTTMDEHGYVTGQAIRRTTYRAPLKLVVVEREQKYARNTLTLALELVEETVTTNAYEDIVFRGGQPNHPQQLSQTKSSSANVKFASGGTYWAEKSREVTSYGYDALGYQEAVTSKKLELNTRLNVMDIVEVQVKTLRQTSQLETEQATSTYKPDRSTGALALQGIDTQRSAGLMPAGPKPPMPVTAGSGDPNAGKEQISLDHWNDTADPAAIDVHYSNIHMTADDLQRILNQYCWASGKWQYELSFDAVAMPWLRKGAILQLSGLLDADGTAIPLGPAIVEDLRLTYDESTDRPAMTSQVLARYWA